jgi:hypothetical protein
MRVLARFAEFCWPQARFAPMRTERASTKTCRIAHSAMASIAYVVVIIAVALLPETRRQRTRRLRLAFPASSAVSLFS